MLNSDKYWDISNINYYTRICNIHHLNFTQFLQMFIIYLISGIEISDSINVRTIFYLCSNAFNDYKRESIKQGCPLNESESLISVDQCKMYLLFALLVGKISSCA